MPLTLTMLRCPPNVAPEVRQVNGGEFYIGRGPENDWVLADPAKHLSKRHCVIAFRNGTWQVAGTSTNGTFLNRDDTPLESRSPRALEDGDRLILGVYEIEVRLTEEADASWGRPRSASPAKPDPFGNPFDDDPFAPSPPSGSPSFGSGPSGSFGSASFSPRSFGPQEFSPGVQSPGLQSPGVRSPVIRPIIVRSANAHLRSRSRPGSILVDPAAGIRSAAARRRGIRRTHTRRPRPGGFRCDQSAVPAVRPAG
jgi:predicted component of type VI protein secretion system